MTCVRLVQDGVLQSHGRKPLLGDGSLDERNAGADICQAIHPAGEFFTTENLHKCLREMIAVFIKKMVLVPTEFLAKLLCQATDIVRRKVCVPNVDCFFEFELFPKVICISGFNFKHSREGERVTSICMFCAVNFNTRVEHA